MKNISVFAVIILFFLCAGCYVAPIHTYRVADENALRSIKEGVTSKEDIIMMLGEPEGVRKQEKLFLYWWREGSGDVIVIQHDAGEIVRGECVLLITFSENNTVMKYEVKKKGIFSGYDSWMRTITEYDLSEW
jgi:outer membrane protein assembly factor BamE (lipoprotein component of BamABCDE complex)